MLYIDGELVVDNDGVHATAEKEGAVALAEGPHDIEIAFFERGASCARGRASLLATLHPLRSPPSLPECTNMRWRPPVGGGATLMASWTPTPGAALAPLGGDALSNEVGCGAGASPPPPDTCDGSSLFFEAYAPADFNFASLADYEATVFEDVWNGWDPIVQHRELEGGIWCGRRAP